MTTTYALTARYMRERDGIEQALRDAKRHAQREARRRDAAPFWRYVVAVLEQQAHEAEA